MSTAGPRSAAAPRPGPQDDPHGVLAAFLPLLKQLAKLSAGVRRSLQRHPLRNPTFGPLIAYLDRVHHAARSIVLLLDAGMPLEAGTLARTVFDIRLSFSVFADLYEADPVNACQCMRDGSFLRSEKNLDQSWRWFDPASAGDALASIAAIGQELRETYDQKKIKEMRAYGLSAGSTESLCKNYGIEIEYDVIYRKLSATAHCYDLADAMIVSGVAPDTSGHFRVNWLSVRTHMVCMTTLIHGGYVPSRTNEMLLLGFGPRLDKLKQAIKEAASRITLPNPSSQLKP